MRTAVWTDSVSVLDRVTAVLEAFGDDEGLGVSEIARRANLPKSTVSRIVTDLVRQRYLDREGTRLHLGLRLFELGQAVERPRRLRRIAHPVMTHLRDTTGESVILAVLDGSDVIVVACVAGRDDAHPVAAVGGRMSARGTALGRAILAHSSDDAGREFAEIRRAGVATVSGSSPGLTCVAGAILAPGCRPVGSIGIAGPSDAIDERRVGGLIRSAASALSQRFQSPAH